MKPIQIPEKPITLALAAKLLADAVSPGNPDAVCWSMNDLLEAAQSGKRRGRNPLTLAPVDVAGISPADYASSMVLSGDDLRRIAAERDIRIAGDDLAKLMPATQGAPAVPVSEHTKNSASTASTVSWHLNEPKRERGYNRELYLILKDEHDAGKPCPKARYVLDLWKANRPPDIYEVMLDEFKYFDSKGNTKSAGLKALQTAIHRMTAAR